MSLRGRFARLFVGRLVVLLAALGLVFLAWGIGVAVYFTIGSARTVRVDSLSPVQLLERVEKGTEVSAEGSVTVSRDTLARLDRQGLWLQVLDSGGDVVFAYEAPRNVPDHYSPGELLLYRQRPAKIGERTLHTWFGERDGRELTWVAGVRKGRAIPWPQAQGVSPGVVDLAWSVVVLLVLGLAVVTVMAMLFGRSLSGPLVHMMDWLGNLASGRYEEPLDRYGRPASLVPGSSRLRGSFARYREVFDSLNALTAELRTAEDRRERLERSRDEWLSGVSHDLKTPLSSVRGYADLLESGYSFTPEEVRAHARVIQEQSAHMLRLLDDLQLTFRLRADALPLAKRRVDAVEFVREAVVDLVNDPRSKGRNVVFDEPPAGGDVPIEVDPAWFRRALGNLLLNAAVHNPEGTTVRASIQRLDGVAIEIADDGRGMDAETVSRLFDRYYRGTSTGEAAEGTGLGMAIARQLIEANGGTIEVESVPGQGTRVRVLVASSASSAA